MSGHKLINDPVYGFITLPAGLILHLIDHPVFQRLRRIRQLGMTHLVYPGAHHTRFHHAIGAMHLMREAVMTLRSKGHEITDEEETGVLVAILLHDIGHGPFSHSLENSLVEGIQHEQLSVLLMEKLNLEFDHQLSLALKIFRDEYPKRFLHQLVSGQLDMDRMDYLNRDSFFTGVSEGIIGSERIIKMLEVAHGQLAVESKGIYSIEKFLVARRLMYWQVYLHKTVVSSECLLVNILKRAKELSRNGKPLFGTPSLLYFLNTELTIADFSKAEEPLIHFIRLDDADISSAIKVWAQHDDYVLKTLCNSLLSRKLYKIRIQAEHFSEEELQKFRTRLSPRIPPGMAHYFVGSGSLENNAYDPAAGKISILYKDGSSADIAEASDTLHVEALSRRVKKYYLYFPEGIPG